MYTMIVLTTRLVTKAAVLTPAELQIVEVTQNVKLVFIRQPVFVYPDSRVIPKQTMYQSLFEYMRRKIEVICVYKIEKIYQLGQQVAKFHFIPLRTILLLCENLVDTTLDKHIFSNFRTTPKLTRPTISKRRANVPIRTGTFRLMIDNLTDGCWSTRVVFGTRIYTLSVLACCVKWAFVVDETTNR